MAGVLESTPTRLVVEFGDRIFNNAVCTFDKATGRARFERKIFRVSRKSIEVGLDEIAVIEVLRQRVKGQTTHTPLIQLKSGQRFWLSDAGQQTYNRAAQMRDFLGLPQPVAGTEGEPTTAAGKTWSWVTRIITWISIAVAALIILGLIVQWFSLPNCDASQTREALRGIFADRKVEITTLTDLQQVAETDAERTCRANVTTPTEKVSITYRVYKENNQTRVQVTGVQPQQ